MGGQTARIRERQKELRAALPQTKETAASITELWEKLGKKYPRICVRKDLTGLLKAGIVKRFEAPGKTRPMGKYWLDPIIR